MDNPPAIPPRGTERIWSILCHLSTFLGVGLILPLVVYLAMKGDSDFVRDNAREALNFHLSLILYGLCCLPLLFVLIGWPLLFLLGVAALVFSIVAAVKASDNRCYHYPLTLRLVK